MAIYEGGIYGSSGLLGVYSSGTVVVGGSVTVSDLIAEGKGATVVGNIGIYGIVFLNRSATSKAVALKGACGPVESLVGERVVTNYGKYLLLQCLVRKVYPEYFSLVLCTDDDLGSYRPTEKTVNFTELKEISQGHGYVRGGVRLNFDEIDFPGLAIVSASDTAYAQMKSVTFTALGGDLPYGGGPIRYAVLLDEDRKVVSYYELSQVGLNLTRGQSMAVQSFRITLS